MALTCQTDSRIADSNRAWQANCNLDITGWDKANEFIISTWALADSVNPDSDFKLQWRRAGGTFADVGADTEICWGTDTVLVDAGALLIGNSAGCFVDWDDGVENEGDNLAYLLNIKNGDYGEIQWALGFGSGALENQEYEIQLVSIDFSNSAICQTSITTTSAGGVSVPINQIVSKVVMFAVTVLTGASILVGQLVASVVPYSVNVKIGQTVPINLQTIKTVPYSPIVKTGTKVSVNLLTAKITPYSPTIKTGVKVPINLLNTKITPYPVTVGGGISVPINLLTLKTNTIAPTISGGAKVSINQLINKTTPYPVIVDIGGIIVPINLITHRVIPYPVVVTSGVKVDVNQLINKIIPYSVTIAAPIKSVKGIVSETLHINGLISMDKDYIAPKGIVSNSFIIKGIMQLQ